MTFVMPNNWLQRTALRAAAEPRLCGARLIDMAELKDYSNSLEDTLKDSDLQNVSIGLAEVVLDNLVDNEIVKEIPIIGSVVGFGKVALGIRERIFLKKIIYFISELKNIPPVKRKKVIDKINNSGKFRTKVGEKLLFIIDRCEDHDKSQLIARMFAAFINEKISYEDFSKSANIIDRIMLEDLAWFINQHYDDFVFEEVGELINVGLVDFDIRDQRELDLKLPSKYELSAHTTDIGCKIRDVLREL